jgi:hypothetical protein
MNSIKWIDYTHYVITSTLEEINDLHLEEYS